MDSKHVLLSEITFTYEDNTRLFEGFGLRLESSKVTALLGGSGVGKSTLGRLVAGLESPVSGAIQRPVDGWRSADMVYVDQNALNSVFPWQSVRRNLDYPLRKLGWTQGQAAGRVAHLLALFRLDHRANAFPAHLSGGELQRLALARTLAWKPKMVVLDEVLSALDQALKLEILKTLGQVSREEGLGILLITHSILDALLLADRCLVIGTRPAKIILDLAIDAPHPRSRDMPAVQAAQNALMTQASHGLID